MFKSKISKKVTSSLLVMAIIFSSNIYPSKIVDANSVASVNPEEIYVQNASSCYDLELDEIDTLSEEQIDEYFESAFEISADDYTVDQKRTSINSIVNAYNLAQNTVTSRAVGFQVSSTEALRTYKGGIGVSWIRDLDASPLSLAECSAGTYTLEFDYLTYGQAACLLAARSSRSTYDAIVAATTTAALTKIVCKALGITATIAVDCAGIVVCVGYDILCSMETNELASALSSIGVNDLIRLKFSTSSGVLTRHYYAYDANGTSLSTAGTYQYSNLPNICSSKYGKWYKDQIGKLYALD